MLGTIRPRRIAVLTALTVLAAGIVTGVVQAATPPDFSVTATPATGTASPGGNVSWTVGAATTDGFDGLVSFSVTGAPAGVSFTTPSVDLTPSTSATALLTASVPASASGGTFSLTVTGTSGTVSHSVPVTLRIRGFTVTMTPASRTILPGTATTYSIAVQSVAGFTGQVTLSASGLPGPPAAGVTITNATRTLSAALPGYTAVLTVTTTPLVPLTTSAFTVTATSPVLQTPVVVNGVLVVAPASATVSAAPSSRVVVKGGPGGLAAPYALTVSRFGVTGPAALSVVGGLPTGVTATFGVNPVPANASASTLTLTAGAGTPVGRHSITVRVAVGLLSSTRPITLVVEQQGQPFTVTGPANALDKLAPGRSVPLNLVLHNPNPAPINVTSLSVALAGTSDEAGCSAAGNYRTQAYGGAVPLVLAANASVSLEQLGVPRSQWPTISMLNLLTNQDACRGVVLNLQYSGTANGGETA